MISINKKILIIISAVILLVIAVVFIYSQFSVDTKLPFDKLKKDMSVEAVHQVLGKPEDSVYDDGALYYDEYKKVRFCGLVGEIEIRDEEVRKSKLPLLINTADLKVNLMALRYGWTKMDISINYIYQPIQSMIVYRRP